MVIASRDIFLALLMSLDRLLLKLWIVEHSSLVRLMGVYGCLCSSIQFREAGQTTPPTCLPTEPLSPQTCEYSIRDITFSQAALTFLWASRATKNIPTPPLDQGGGPPWGLESCLPQSLFPTPRTAASSCSSGTTSWLPASASSRSF